jgi:integrase
MGTVFRRGDRWVGRLPVGRNPDGSTRYVERSGKTQKAVIDALKKVEAPGPDTTVSQWLDRWLANLSVRVGTREQYELSAANYLRPALGHFRVRDLTAYHVESAVRQWGERPAPGRGRPVSANTVRLHVAHLSVCLNAAVRAGLIPTNPVGRARRPRGTKKKMDPFPPADLKRIIAEAVLRPGTRIVAFLAATGARIGEGIALTTADWNPAARTVSITKTQSSRMDRPPGPPKSPYSVRTIRVPVPLEVPDRPGPLFPTRDGGHPSHATVTKAWQGLLKRLGFRRRSPHQLRHSVATALVAAGEPLPDVAAFLGDTVQTIVATYLHRTGSDPAAALERILGG